MNLQAAQHHTAGKRTWRADKLVTLGSTWAQHGSRTNNTRNTNNKACPQRDGIVPVPKVGSGLSVGGAAVQLERPMPSVVSHGAYVPKRKQLDQIK